MGLRGRKPGTQKTGGRQKGSKNKETLEIKQLLDSEVDFATVIQRLYQLVDSKNPDANAAKILLAYRYGQPKQEIEQTGEQTVKIIREVIE